MLKRYGRTSLLGQKKYSTPEAVKFIRQGVKSGSVSTLEYIVSGSERLDVIAAKKYGNSKLWWVIAAASNVGWALQVPPGTRLLIPNNLNQIAGYVG